MPYRARPLTCPRCNVDLVQRGTEDRWRCQQCRGAALTRDELVSGLGTIAPQLLHDGKDAVALTDERRPVDKPLACPSCHDPMERVRCGTLDIDRCFRDELLWFDDWEHVTLMAAARDTNQHAWLRELLQMLFPEP